MPLVVLAAPWRDWRSWTNVDRETIQRSFAAGGDARVLVDNIGGFIHVTGYDGNKIEINVQKEARAESQAALDRSRREVKLDIQQTGGTVKLYVDGPFRNKNGMNYRGDDYYGYHVTYDYEIRVPRAAVVDLKTINNGDIEVKGTSGDFSVHGLNGGINMEGVSGSGVVHTLNGKVRVAFARNPQRDCEFHTLNGAMDVYFQQPLNADLHYRTLNGGVYADFDVTPLPGQAGSGQLQGGRYLYRSRGGHSGRAGSGGPSLKFDGLNGAIRLHTTTL
ncbi:MAG TPA: hypothetical protein VGS58_08895 [Candidatus Sulfopaludibacter sp.]|nr:hypothetical protein [Candidatus Sulfopaludibacter sp.]